MMMGRRMVVIALAARGWGGGGDCEREWQHRTFGRQDQGIFHHCSATGVLIGVLGSFNGRMITKGGHRCLTGFIIFNHIDSCFEALLVHRRWEGGRVIEANENTDIEEILFIDAKVGHDAPFGDIVEGRFGC